MLLSEKKFKRVKKAVGALGMGLTLLFLLTHFTVMYIPSTSMEPTYKVNDLIVIWRTQFVNHGDIIMVSKDTNDNRYAKRIIGLPGDTIAIHDGKAWRNGEPLEEPYLKEQYIQGNFEETTVPDGKVFCMGDNRNNSADSRIFGCFDIQNIIGKALFKIL